MKNFFKKLVCYPKRTKEVVFDEIVVAEPVHVVSFKEFVTEKEPEEVPVPFKEDEEVLVEAPVPVEEDTREETLE